jgi:hypothetical protein
MSWATSKLAQSLPAASTACRTILMALAEYSGDATVLSSTPSPMAPATARPVALVAAIQSGTRGRTGFQPSCTPSSFTTLPA